MNVDFGWINTFRNETFPYRWLETIFDKRKIKDRNVYKQTDAIDSITTAFYIKNKQCYNSGYYQHLALYFY